MAPATSGMGNSGCSRTRETQPEKPQLIRCLKAKGRAVEVPSHSAQLHRVSQPKTPANERGLGPAPAAGRGLKCSSEDEDPGVAVEDKDLQRDLSSFCSGRGNSLVAFPLPVWGNIILQGVYTLHIARDVLPGMLFQRLVL